MQGRYRLGLTSTKPSTMSYKSSCRSLSVLPAVALLAMVLSACSSGERPAGQVAVKVNDGELSVHQVNAQLARMRNIAPEQQDAVRKRVVDSLIDQQLLIERAMAAKLDRDPEVLDAIEQSRAQILAQAYVRKSLGEQARPGENDVKRYFDENPALFAQRRIYRIEEIGTDAPIARADELRQVVQRAKTIGEVAQWLQKNGFKVAANVAVRGAEQLPMPQLKAIHALKDGDKTLLEGPRGMTVVHLLASQSQPLDAEQARPMIEQYLGNRKRDELAREELKRLREQARIEYLGEFAKLAALTPAPAAEAATPAVAGAASAAEPAAPGKPGDAGTARSASTEVIDRGLSGLR
jgi:EpsD family peptidyl-prolyl cis-trans isomerase